MTPQEKANELFLKYYECLPPELVRFTNISDNAVKCAIIAVDEILRNDNINVHLFDENDKYWLEVKKELEKL